MVSKPNYKPEQFIIVLDQIDKICKNILGIQDDKADEFWFISEYQNFED